MSARKIALNLANGDLINANELGDKTLILANLKDIRINCDEVIKQLVADIKKTA